MRCDIHVCSDFFQLLARQIPSASGFPGTRLQLVLSKSRVLPPNGSFNRENGEFRSFQNFGGHFSKVVSEVFRGSALAQFCGIAGIFFRSWMVETCWKPQQKEWVKQGFNPLSAYHPISHMIGFLMISSTKNWRWWDWWRIGSLGVRLVSCSTSSILAKSAETGFHQFDPKQNWSGGDRSPLHWNQWGSSLTL